MKLVQLIFALQELESIQTTEDIEVVVYISDSAKYVPIDCVKLIDTCDESPAVLIDY